MKKRLNSLPFNIRVAIKLTAQIITEDTPYISMSMIAK